jgi:Flp pilus assembly protein TadD
MNVSSAASASGRLDRLAACLQHDPDNAALLADACDAALACGRHEAVESFLSSAERLSLQAPEWQHRRAHWCIARRDLPQARSLLEDLAGRNGQHPVLMHDLAHVHLLQGDAAGAHALLAPWAEDDFDEPDLPQEAMQALWLRACHGLGRIDEAWDWARRVQAAGRLQPQAAGVASLVALDQEDLAAAAALADLALAADGMQQEALVTRGSLALAAGRAEEATHWLESALRRNEDDGRTWSALGFASLLVQDFPSARQRLERAVVSLTGDAQTWQALAWTCLLLQDTDGALAAFRSAVDADGGSAESQASLGLALVLSGRREEAEPFLLRAEELEPDDGLAAMARALASGSMGPGDVQDLVQGLLAQWRLRP